MQGRFILTDHTKARFLDLEGAVRSGKTTPAIWKLIKLAVDYPGIKMLMARWTGDALDMQLKPKFYEECPPELLKQWHAKEEYQEFTNGSWLYMRSLKSSDDGSRYAKFTGLTLAVIYIDQPEELPEDIWAALKARLSQPGYPQQMFITPNPPAPNHWLCKEFPEDNSVPGHHYMHTSVYDNRAIIGDQYIAELERDYPVGHALRRRWIEGRRGFSIDGEPVYKGAFSRHLHVKEMEFLLDYPLIESWDFGHRHPAVTWHQFTPWGHWNILGEIGGDSVFIDQFLPLVDARRRELFPGLLSLRVVCDPAGATAQGLRHTSVEVLNDHLRSVYGPGVGVTYDTTANTPKVRGWCLQQISSYMTRLVQGRPALLVHPRCERTADGFEAGYVYDDRTFTGTLLPNQRRPKKDGFYDHYQNTVEYVALDSGSNRIPTDNMASLSQRDRLRAMQRDTDEFDDWNYGRRQGSRAGY